MGKSVGPGKVIVQMPGAVVLSQGQLCPSSPETLDNVWRHFGCHRWTCCWHLMGRGQGCCLTSSVHRTAATQGYPALKVNIDIPRLRNPALGLSETLYLLRTETKFCVPFPACFEAKSRVQFSDSVSVVLIWLNPRSPLSKSMYFVS